MLKALKIYINILRHFDKVERENKFITLLYMYWISDVKSKTVSVLTLSVIFKQTLGNKQTIASWVNLQNLILKCLMNIWGFNNT